MVEGTEKHPIDGAELPQQRKHGMGHRSFLEFHDHRRSGIPFQNLCKRGDISTATGVDASQLIRGHRRHRARSVGRTVQRWIVNHDGHTVFRGVHVQLESVGTRAQCRVKRRKGVLGVCSRGSSVPDKRPGVRVDENHARTWASIAMRVERLG